MSREQGPRGTSQVAAETEAQSLPAVMQEVFARYLRAARGRAAALPVSDRTVRSAAPGALHGESDTDVEAVRGDAP
jgi:hypothetical protein